MNVGDKVKFSAKFLRNIGIHKGDMCFAEGEITELTKLGDLTLAQIVWNCEDTPALVNAKNLTLVGKLELPE